MLTGVEVTVAEYAAYRRVVAECLVLVPTAASKHGILMTLSVAARPPLLHIRRKLVNIAAWLSLFMYSNVVYFLSSSSCCCLSFLAVLSLNAPSFI